MQFIAASINKDRMDTIMQDQEYSRMDRDAVSVLEACTNIKIPQEYEKEGKVDMCKAWTDQFTQAQMLGRQEGRQEGRLEGGNTMVYVMVQDGDTSPERGAKRLGITVEELKKRMSASGYKFPE